MNVRQFIKKTVVGSPLEPLARWVYHTAAGTKDYVYNRQTLEVMRRVLKCDSCFVDVGAHTGEILRQAVALAPEGKHWAFEPLPHLAKNLKSEFPSANVFNVALSDTSGVIEFGHDLDMPGRSGMKRTPMDAGHKFKKIATRTKPLDSLISGRIDMIKIDVEGAELLVFRGAKETISRNKPVIVFEHGLGGADSYGHTPEQVFDLLTDCGMTLSTMTRWLANDAPLSRGRFCDYFYAGKDFYFIAISQSS
ncbi:MAG TPA: FkbM family methyltransferase [Candidatus Angelobacter sp.]|jgi:FkbM family methyltransferase|nr:FkbM family methyltransferase [Candidatus Angelobacter sp.]